MKKLSILTQYYKPEIGAPQNRLLEMAEGLKSNGWDVSIITSMPNYPTGKIFARYKRKFFLKEVIDEMPIHRYWLFASNSKRTIPRIISMLSFSIMALFSFRYLRKQRPDILIVESPPLTLGITGVILSKLCGSKFVLNISDLWPLSAKELGAISEGYIYRLLERLETYLYRKSHLSLGQSTEIVNYLKEHGANETYLFRNGVTPERFNIQGEIVRKERTLVYAGLLGVAQGIYELCKNVDFAKLNVEFHIYGDGLDKASIMSYIKENACSNIYYHGSVTREEIPSVLKSYSASLILLVKNIFGAVPSKIYEAMAAGLPIIFSGEGEAVTIIEDNNLGWCAKSRDYNQLMKNIGLAFKDDEVFRIKREACLKASENKFNRRKQMSALSKELLKLIK